MNCWSNQILRARQLLARQFRGGLGRLQLADGLSLARSHRDGLTFHIRKQGGQRLAGGDPVPALDQGLFDDANHRTAYVRNTEGFDQASKRLLGECRGEREDEAGKQRSITIFHGIPVG